MTAQTLPDGCVEWPGRRDKDGYGCMHLAGEKRAHRALYRLFCGPIPPGMQVLHSCDNPCCVNPAHLSLGTPSVNAADRVNRNRQPRGLVSAQAKLDADGVAFIRGGADRHAACEKLGIGKSTYYRVRAGESYSGKQGLSQ